MKLGELMKEKRNFLNITKEEMADTIDVSAKTIENWESDVHPPNPDKFVIIMNTYQIFRDDFRGKLGEVALLNYVQTYMPDARINRNIDYRAYERGKWDLFDIIINGRTFNVKSVKQGSSFLMIEQYRFNQDGSYSYRNDDGSKINVDDYVLARVTINWPEGHEAHSDGINIHKNMNDLLAEEAKRKPESVYAEILGGVTSYDFWKNKHCAKKGIPCNYNSLNDVCAGKQVGQVTNPQNYSKTKILQQDNYIMSYRELQDVSCLENLSLQTEVNIDKKIEHVDETMTQTDITTERTAEDKNSMKNKNQSLKPVPEKFQEITDKADKAENSINKNQNESPVD